MATENGPCEDVSPKVGHFSCHVGSPEIYRLGTGRVDNFPKLPRR